MYEINVGNYISLGISVNWPGGAPMLRCCEEGSIPVAMSSVYIYQGNFNYKLF